MDISRRNFLRTSAAAGLVPLALSEEGGSSGLVSIAEQAAEAPALTFETAEIEAAIRVGGDYHGVSRLLHKATGRQVIDPRYSALNLFRLFSVNSAMGLPRRMPRTSKQGRDWVEITWPAGEAHQGIITARYEQAGSHAIDLSRAGSASAYSFGDDPAELESYAWYSENSSGQYQPVGTKRPNGWGLHDMHGNVMEWMLDEYLPERYQLLENGVLNPWLVASRSFTHVARGGSWADPAPALRCAARRASYPSWQMQDPQLPKSLWYHTDAPWIGFRLVRPLQVPSAEEMYLAWNPGQ